MTNANKDLKDFLDSLPSYDEVVKSELAAERKANVDSVYAPLGTEARQPKIAPKRQYPRAIQNKNALLAEFGKEYPQVVEWLDRKAEGSDFARSLQDFMIRTGTLTDKQIAAVERGIARDAEYKANRESKVAERVNAAPTVDISKIETAFRKAQENDVKTPKMRLANFLFSLAPAHGKNPNAIYVKMYGIEEEVYLGKIMGGRFLKVRECDDATAAKVIEVASNPHEAAKAYGQRTGNCSVCGRTLTKHASIDARIGPICAGKYGW